MAHDEINYEIEQVKHDIGLTPITLSLAVLAGLGVTLMIASLAIGVIFGENAGNNIGLLFIMGLLALITGAGAWFGIVRPDTHFDDINQPLNSGHGHTTHEEHPAGTEIVVTDNPSVAATAAEPVPPAAHGHSPAHGHSH